MAVDTRQQGIPKLNTVQRRYRGRGGRRKVLRCAAIYAGEGTSYCLVVRLTPSTLDLVSLGHLHQGLDGADVGLGAGHVKVVHPLEVQPVVGSHS